MSEYFHDLDNSEQLTHELLSENSDFYDKIDELAAELIDDSPINPVDK